VLVVNEFTRRFHFWLVMLLGIVPATAQVDPSLLAPMAKTSFRSSALIATGKPVARVNGTVLTDRDLLREMLTIFPYARQHGGKFPEAMEADIRRGALSTIEFEELVFQEAGRRGVNVTSTRLDHAIKAFRDQFASKAEFQGYLKEECGNSMTKLRAKVRRSIMIDDLLLAEIAQKALVSEEQVRSFYQKNPARFLSPESVSLQTISIGIPDKPTPEQEEGARKRAEDALRQARKTKNYEEFGMLAEKISEDDWRVMMGDHQSVTHEQMPPEAAKVAFSMKPNQISDLIRTENSWCILRVNGQQDAHQITYEQAKDSLKKELQASRVETLRQALHQRLRKTAKIEEL
jgi:parvulin-like peptidyl-prolyl isomerase